MIVHWSVTSEACRRRSSGAAEAVEEALLAGEDTGDVRGLRSCVPLVDLERAAEDDAVGPRKHVAEVAERRILDFGLGLEDRQLAARRVHVLVVEKVAASETGAVEHEAIGQRGDVGGSPELA